MSNPPTPETPAPEEADAGSGQPEQAPQQPRYAPPQYAAPQYAPPQQPQPQYGQPQYGQPQYGQQQYAPPQYAQPQYVPVLPPPGPGEPFDGAVHAGELNRPLYGANMGQAITRFFKNYANFSGRASRSEYWWMALALALLFFALAMVGGIFGSLVQAASYYRYGSGDIIAGFFGLILLLVFLGIIIPCIALTWRRMHDANLPGPLYFLTFVPYVGGLVVFIFTLLSPKPEGRRFDRPNR